MKLISAKMPRTACSGVPNIAQKSVWTGRAHAQRRSPNADSIHQSNSGPTGARLALFVCDLNPFMLREGEETCDREEHRNTTTTITMERYFLIKTGRSREQGARVLNELLCTHDPPFSLQRTLGRRANLQFQLSVEEVVKGERADTIELSFWEFSWQLPRQRLAS